jgi:uncharacterized protein YgbK (DUF1537 family)
VVADDLTGACDAGVAFLPAFVVLRSDLPLTDSDTLVYSTGSRDEAPEVARARLQALPKHLFDAEILFQKIDSVLRGNVRSDIETMLSLSGRGRAIVCPAFPEQGRTVVNGIAEPAGVNLRALLAGLPVEIPDAVTNDDLARIAMDTRPLLVGSAGLARFIGKLPPRISQAQMGQGIAVMCIGSVHPVTLGQLDGFDQAEIWRIDMAAPDLSQLTARVGALQAGGLMLSGGDTAVLICDHLGAKGIRLEAEVEAGIPIGRIIGGVGDGLAVITKSGGFGGPSTLGCIARVLSAQNRRK